MSEDTPFPSLPSAWPGVLRVVNVSSASTFDGSGSSIAYTASKAALNSMTQSLARALGPLIRVNAVCPGYMDSPWWLKARAKKAPTNCVRRCAARFRSELLRRPRMSQRR